MHLEAVKILRKAGRLSMYVERSPGTEATFTRQDGKHVAVNAQAGWGWGVSLRLSLSQHVRLAPLKSQSTPKGKRNGTLALVVVIHQRLRRFSSHEKHVMPLCFICMHEKFEHV